MNPKIIFLLAIVTLSYGLPVTESSDESSLDLEADSQGPNDGNLQQLLLWEVSAANAAKVVEDNSPIKQKREACRSVEVRTKSGRTITVSKC